MNRLSQIMLLVSVPCLLTVLPAQAEQRSARLRATNGTEISVNYDRQVVGSPGASRTVIAKNLLVRVADSTANAIRAVLINSCHAYGAGDFSVTYTCDLSQGRSRPLPATLIPLDCRASGAAYDVNYLAQFDGILVSNQYRSGNAVCSQELAVVVDGNWLRDPVNGSSNFRLQL